MNEELTKNRCGWISDPLMQKYHDEEWGVPLHDDRKIFEFMVLDAFQAGLSWKTILNKRENFRRAFDNFIPEKIARYDEAKYEELLKDEGIIRNRSKIRATISNANAFLAVQKEFGTFDRYIWSFVGHTMIRNSWKSMQDIPAKTEVSDRMSKDLADRGFKFVGSTICYAFMQAAGMVNDHITGCFRYKELQDK
ncbi:MAG: DNA-3-methyladenine glycosylase I [Bacteroidales bacterium]|nr:DNA-3-methyladenine glycosylase I [Bacteroidales bacterium]